MVTPDLLIPLAWLPGPLPVGTPVVATAETMLHWPASGDWRILSGWRGAALPLGEVAWMDAEGEPWGIAAPDDGTVALDLTPPPTDAAGYPLRVDGLDVAAAMLARAMRLPGSPAWLELHESDDAPAGYRVRLRAMRSGRWPLPSVYLDTLAGPLPQVDPADPLAVRRLMVELYRRRVWEAAP